jgi:hypothetical protein
MTPAETGRTARRRRGRGPDPARVERGPSGLAAGLDRVPVWVPPVLFALLTAWLFRAFIFSGDMLFGSDTMSLGYQARHFFAEALRTTGFPLWNPHILGGTPFLEALSGGDSLHPLSVALLLVMDTYRALGWKLVIHVFLAGLFTYGWLRTLGASRGGALVGGTGALLAPSFVTLVFPGHDGKMFVVAMTPLLFWLAESMWRRRDLVPGALLALSIALVIFSTHFQMAYFLFGALGAYMAFRAVQVGRMRGWRAGATGYGVFLGFSLLGAGIGAIQLLPAVEYVTEFSRRAATTVEAASPDAARAYSASWSLHPEEAASLLVPEFVGGSVGGSEWTDETYWGRNAFKLNHEYLGVVLLLLALLAFLPGPARSGEGSEDDGQGEDPADGNGAVVGVPGPSPGDGPPRATRWFLAGLGIVAALFALGANTPVWRGFYEVLPGVSLFRAPSMVIFLTAFATCTLAGLGVDRAARELATAEGRKRVVAWTGGAAAVLAVGVVLAASGLLLDLWQALLYRDIPPDRMTALGTLEPYILRGFLVVTALAGGLAAAFWAAGKGMLSAPLFLAVATGLVIVDLARVNAPFIQVTDATRLTVPDANLRFLEGRTRQEPPFRVFSMVRSGADVQPSAFGIDLAAGHHPNDLLRYQELIGMEGGGVPQHLLAFHPVVMAALNVRYLLWPDAQLGPLEGVEPVSRIQTPDGRPWTSVYPYPGLPRAYLVGRYRLVAPDETLGVLLDDPTFDPGAEVLLEVAPPFEPGTPPAEGPSARGTVQWVEREPDRLVLDVEAEAPALLVVSQNWFPSWAARVGDDPTPVLRANHTLQAVAIPAGRQRVEISVESEALGQALLLSGVSLLLTMGAGIASGLVARRRRDPGSANGTPL